MYHSTVVGDAALGVPRAVEGDRPYRVSNLSGLGENNLDIIVGDILTLKKKHPCGSTKWQTLRIGADFKLKCLICGHEIMSPRNKVEKNVKQIERNQQT